MVRCLKTLFWLKKCRALSVVMIDTGQITEDSEYHESLDMDYRKFISRIGCFREEIPENIRPTWLKLTTITMVSSHLRDQGVELDHDKLKKVFKNMQYLTIVKKGASGGTFNWQIFYGKTEFYNQVTIGYQDSLSTKKVKIFPNGSLQVAGCVDISDCHRFIDQLQVILMAIYGVHLPRSTFRIVMINSNFSLNYSINLMNVITAFEKENFSIVFDPDRYSAVKIKFKPVEDGKQITTSIFASGSIIITGAENLNEVSEAYVKIVSVLNSCRGVYVEASPSIKDFDYFGGYMYSNLFSKIMSDTTKNVL